MFVPVSALETLRERPVYLFGTLTSKSSPTRPLDAGLEDSFRASSLFLSSASAASFLHFSGGPAWGAPALNPDAGGGLRHVKDVEKKNRGGDDDYYGYGYGYGLRLYGIPTASLT